MQNEANDTNENINEVAMPSDDEIRRQIVDGWDLLSMPTGDSPRRDRPFDRSKFTPEQLERMVEGKLERGPGKYANAYEIEVWSQFKQVRDAEEKIKRLQADHDRVARYDPVTGDPYYAFSESRRKAMREEADHLRSVMTSFDGDFGAKKLAEALDKAVEDTKRRYQIRADEAAAQRLADEMERDSSIKRRALAILEARGKKTEATQAD